jgi:hypothetical protein
MGIGATAFGLVGFGAHSGFSRNVGTHWQAGTAIAHHYLCGNDNVFTQAHRIFAGIS